MIFHNSYCVYKRKNNRTFQVVETFLAIKKYLYDFSIVFNKKPDTLRVMSTALFSPRIE